MNNFDNSTAVLNIGGAAYDIEDSRVDIEDLIESLEAARNSGITHVVVPSGNYRGAKWMAFNGGWDWMEDYEVI